MDTYRLDLKAIEQSLRHVQHEFRKLMRFCNRIVTP
jgi:hypothetical protein